MNDPAASFPASEKREQQEKSAAAPDPRFLMGIVGDWIVCISVSTAQSHTTETLKLIKGWRRPPPPKQLVTGRSPAGSTEAPAAARQRLEVPSLLRMCVTGAALQKDGQNPQKSMDAQQQQFWLVAAVVMRAG